MAGPTAQRGVCQLGPGLAVPSRPYDGRLGDGRIVRAAGARAAVVAVAGAGRTALVHTDVSPQRQRRGRADAGADRVAADSRRGGTSAGAGAARCTVAGSKAASRGSAALAGRG